MATQQKQRARPWYWDGLASLAFWGQAIFWGKIAARIFGPIGAFFVFAINAAIGYFFWRLAWRGFLAARGGTPVRKAGEERGA